MFAIVEIAGLQYKVEQDQKLYVHRLSAEKGAKLTFDKVLMTVNGTVTVGAPAVKGASVEAEVLDHVKADKVIVFKKKRRKGYTVKNGHRQQLTQIQITGLTGMGEAVKVTKKASLKAEVAAEPAKETVTEKTVSNSDHATVNFSEDHELNYHLKKHQLSQSKGNREVLINLGKELKEKLGKNILTHEEVDTLIDENIAQFAQPK